MESSSILHRFHRTYQRRGYLSRRGYARLDSVLVSQAQLYNQALEMRRNAYELGGVPVTWQDQFKWLTGLRYVHSEQFSSLSLEVQRGTLLRLDRAFRSFFRRVEAGQTPGYPRFKSHHRWHSIELAEATPGMVRDGKVRIKGIPAIGIADGGLPDSSRLKALRITRKGRRVTMNLTYVEEAHVLPASDVLVGIDLGVSDRLALSNGKSIGRRVIDRDGLAEKQRRLARCKKGSREWGKRKAILSNAHGRDSVRNRNHCHRITSEIIKDFGRIAVEDLKVRNMTSSAKGTVENPGTNVKAKSRLNREIINQTWGMLREQLRYKAEWAGREFVVVSAQHTSQRCSECGVIDPANRREKAYHCRSCGYQGDADVNAARNILARAFGGWELPAAVPEAA